LIAGFANGVVALWNLETQSPILLNDKVLYPVWSFYAHSTVVTGETRHTIAFTFARLIKNCMLFFSIAISLSPHHTDARFIATASVDRSVKLWDRFDSSIPVCCSKRSRVTDIKWRRHWPGVLVCIEDVCAYVETVLILSSYLFIFSLFCYFIGDWEVP